MSRRARSWAAGRAALFALAAAAGPALAKANAPQAPPGTASAASAASADQGADPALLRRFLAQSPGHRLHTLGMTMNAQVEALEAPGLRLERLWVGQTDTLVELVGLSVPGRSASAVMQMSSLSLQHAGGNARLIEAEGGERLTDRKGGQALVVRPGETVWLRFDPVDDWRPMALQHFAWQGTRFVYFENIDPRFRERYDQAYRNATAPGATGPVMSEFLVEFAAQDPDGRSREVFAKLIQAMRAQNTFEGYFTVFQLMQDPEDARRAASLAQGPAQKEQIEQLAVSALADKSRLVDFRFSVVERSTSGGETVNSGFFGPTLNFLIGKDAVKVARRPIEGRLRVDLKKVRPIPLSHGEYEFRFQITFTAPRDTLAKGFLVGASGPSELRLSHMQKVRLSASQASADVPVSLGNAEIAYLDRGRMGATPPAASRATAGSRCASLAWRKPNHDAPRSCPVRTPVDWPVGVHLRRGCAEPGRNRFSRPGPPGPPGGSARGGAGPAGRFKAMVRLIPGHR